MEFHFTNDSPVYLQMARILETMVVNGDFSAGSRLPSVRELAAASRTNPNTVSKALGVLEKKGLIETRRTAGKFVCERPELLEDSRKNKGQEYCARFWKQMSALGFAHDEVIAMLESEIEHAAGNRESQ